MLQTIRPARPLRATAIALLALAALADRPSTAHAQDAGGDFISRGIQGIMGGGPGGDRPSGAYASPSGIPDSSGLGGLSAPRALEKLDPIPLPKPLDGEGRVPLKLPRLPAYAPQVGPTDIIRSRKTLSFEAKLTRNGATIPSGLIWRLFSPIEGPDGKLPLVASAKGGTADFEVPAGDYLLHVGFGRAGVTKRVKFGGQQTREIVVLEAGGLKLGALSGGDVAIPAELLTFDIYSDAPQERDRQLVANDVPAQKIVRLNAGTYHIVSNFGSINAAVRADVRVEAGKITEATLQHRAAMLTMKLVREKGGEAIADTAWSISNASGDVVQESVGAFPSMVLTEGDYLIVARNKDRMYQREFQVEAGKNTDVEVLTSDLLTAPDTSQGSGD